MPFRYCHFHADEDIAGTRLEGEEAGYTYTCDRRAGHPHERVNTWLEVPPPPGLPAMSGLAAELGLDVALPELVAPHAGRWVEYGVVEALYAEAHPREFAHLVDRYGHTAIEGTRYSASSFIASTLGHLSRTGELLLEFAPATGRWDYNQQISWWAMPSNVDTESRVSWYDQGRSMDYVPGSTETCGLGRCTGTAETGCRKPGACC